jgi:hypothetical protein
MRFKQRLCVSLTSSEMKKEIRLLYEQASQPESRSHLIVRWSTLSQRAALFGSFPHNVLAVADATLTFAAMNDAPDHNLLPRQATTIVQGRLAAGNIARLDLWLGRFPALHTC